MGGANAGTGSRWLKPGGVLAFVIPGDRLAECSQILATHFRDVRVFRLEAPECVRYRQAGRILFAEPVSATGRPLTPLHAGHVGLLACSGLLNGIFLRLDRFIGEVESEGTCKAHLISEGVKKLTIPVILSAAKNLQLFVFKKINADASLRSA